MQVFAILNQKGGSAKTTTAVNLGSALAEKKQKVLLIDLDPQGSATSWLGLKNTSNGLYSVFAENGSILDFVEKTCVNGMDMIASSRLMVAIDKILAARVAAETILKKKLEAVKEKSWDYVLIDCPPALGMISLNALVASASVIVPVETHIMSVQGLADLLNTIQQVKESLNPTLDIHGILPCRVNKRTRLAQDIIEDLRKRFGKKIYQTTIRETVKLAEAPSFGRPINIYDPRSPGAEDYRSLATEVIKSKRRI